MKKLFSILLVAVLVLGAMPVTAFAAESATVSVEKVTGVAAGATNVAVSIDISDATFGQSGFIVGCDSALTMKSISLGNMPELGDANVTSATRGIFGSGSNKNADISGTIATVYFDVPADAEPGAIYPVTVTVDFVAAITEEGGFDFVDVAVVDGYIQIKEEEKHEHSWSDWTVTEEPTCTETGLKVRSCACGETQEEVIPALGHAWDNGVVTKDPTCTEEGVMTFTCTRCGETKTEPIAVVDHIWAWYNPCCDGEGGDHRHVRECTICGTQKDAGACVGVEIGSNDLGNGKTETLYECSVCSHKWTVVTTSGTPVDPEPEDPNLDDVPRTDDITGQVVMTASAALICMVAAVAFIFKRKAAK